jgi:glutaredoxin-related protein
MKEYLSSNGVKFAYMDITENMFNMKAYLKYRDNRPEFDEIKSQGRLGVPFISINGGEKLIFDEKPDIKELLED